MATDAGVTDAAVLSPWAVAKRFAGIVDPHVIAARAAQLAREALECDLAAVGLSRGSDMIQIDSAAGQRTDHFVGTMVPAGAGIGGKILVVKGPISVQDYSTDERITQHFVQLVVRDEGIRGMCGVPIMAGEMIMGVLYAGLRAIRPIEDRGLDCLNQVSSVVGPALAAASALDRQISIRVEQERYKIASNLHDSVGHLLFAIGISVRRLEESLPYEASGLVSEVRDLQRQVSQAASLLRDGLRALSPETPYEGLAVVLQTDVDAFVERTGIAGEFLLVGTPFDVGDDCLRVIRQVVREGLHNVEKHAEASSFLVTLRYSPTVVTVAVQDDGRGISAEQEVEAIPGAAAGLGLPSLHQRIGCIGGALRLVANDDGGTTLRATVPVRAT